MDLSGLLVQLLNGLASASTLFLVAAGLSLIFGVTRIVNFAHGSLYMLGLYLAYSCVERLGGALDFWPALLLAPLVVGALGALVEVVLLRRIYRAPELLQLLATFALVLVIKDAALALWGPEELFGPRAPGVLAGAVTLLGRRFPVYDLLLIAIGPLVLLLLTALLARTRWGRLVRAATQDREMVGALGVNQAWLFTGVFALGALLAGLAGALQLPREPASLELDLAVVTGAFVVVVVGGMGSLPGAFLAALLISELKALCIWLGVVQLGPLTIAFPKLTLAAEFLVMAAVLLWRPWGLLGRPQAVVRALGPAEAPLHAAAPTLQVGAVALLALLAAVPWLAGADSYATVLLTDVFIAALFAASLHALVGPGGVHSFGHAAYFGLGAYGAALLVHWWQLPFALALAAAPLVAAAGALVYGWLCVRLSGIYLAMLTLAFAQLTWAVAFQWDAFTGGSNGLTGIWPPEALARGAGFYWLALGLCAAGIALLRRALLAPWGLALRAARDAPARAEAVGIDVRRIQWAAFVLAGALAGLAGALFAYSKGSVAPDVLAVARSVDGLAMVLLGGVQTLAGPLVGAAAFTWLHDSVARASEYWRALLGGTVLLLVLLFPQGIAGVAQRARALLERRRSVRAQP
ncbi:ABC transporter permease [Melaminivora alkalimesophila]|uniref:Amino acid/amide ABC transporter membrane protein 1 (HAAT family) /amino acid/amide ABC transporter membrane protein 2 (HAAT family) n=1 Tax=Melaminivora alkalimesophila TaxID=1165852 RepID=A0A317RD45_9BURK|nr:ABC transporter permease [Melaminivora alkalimesophila]PWW47013.1 amino acid/amide ABC transporter membrane protein 1 (HAAT family) /amino acid/amide ABC transporter membrane protein 2 (HAAT family) [Melaminivora alkalimesophila]